MSALRRESLNITTWPGWSFGKRCLQQLWAFLLHADTDPVFLTLAFGCVGGSLIGIVLSILGQGVQIILPVIIASVVLYLLAFGCSFVRWRQSCQKQSAPDEVYQRETTPNMVTIAAEEEYVNVQTLKSLSMMGYLPRGNRWVDADTGKPVAPPLLDELQQFLPTERRYWHQKWAVMQEASRAQTQPPGQEESA